MKKKGQSVIEFCFATMVFSLLVFGLVRTVRWTMMDLSERRYHYDSSLVSSGDAAVQLQGDFHQPRKIDAVLFKKP